MITRLLAALALPILLLLFASAHAATAPALDPEQATRAWIATMGPEATARSNAYYEGGYWIQFAGPALAIVISLGMMIFGWAKSVRSWLERSIKIYFLVALGMAFFYLAVATALTTPFAWYAGFVREHQYGLSTQTFPEWFGEYLLDASINTVFGSIFLAILYLIVRAAKSAWWIWAAAVTSAFLILAIAVTPVFIAPLFNTYTPMAEGPLKDDILAMAQASGVPADNVYVYDESRQSNRVSANVSGLFGTMRISLADNLLERASPDGVRMVMGHEIGHYVLGHIASLIFMLSVLFCAVFAIVHHAFGAIVKGERWGVRAIADPAGLPLAVALFTGLMAIATPATNNITRFHEHQADIFGLHASRAPDGFAETALLLSEYRKMEPSPFEEWFFYDHPSGHARIRMAMQWKAHEIAAGRHPPGPGGPPPGWRPDFVAKQAAALSGGGAGLEERALRAALRAEASD